MKALLGALLFGGACLAADKAPQHVRVSIQYIEVPHPALTGWLGEGETGAVIHAKAMTLAESGEAKILDTCMVICRSGQKAWIVSVLEEIYPVEYEPPGFVPPENWKWFDPADRGFAAFETKNTGLTFDADLTIDADRPVVDLRVSPEF